MIEDGLIIKTRKERFAVPERMGLITGKFQGNIKGFGFVIPDIDHEDIFIPANEINGAMNVTGLLRLRSFLRGQASRRRDNQNN